MMAQHLMSETASARDLTGAASEWLSQSWRLTAFLSEASPPGEVNWWRELVGEEPDTRVDNRRQGIHQEQGPFKKGALILGVLPGRVDWVYTVRQDAEELSAQAPTLGPATEALAEF